MTMPAILTEAEQHRFFQDVLARAEQARGPAGSQADLLVGGTVVRLLFSSPGLESAFLPALSHLRAAEGRAPDLVLHVWESETSGVELPPAPCPTACFSDRGELWTMPSQRIRSAFHWLEGSLSLLDLETRQAIYWVRSIDRIPYWTAAAPFRGLLNWWMEANGGQLLHAAAVGVEDEAVLITGKGGAGKSTTALACLEAGMRFAGDDYVIVTGGAEPRVWSLYRTAKIEESAMERFAAFRPEMRRFGSDGKAVIMIDPAQPGLLSGSMRIAAILTPEFSDAPNSVVERVTRDRIRHAALFTTMCQLPHVGQPTLTFIDSLIDSVPSGLLKLGSDRQSVPAVVAAILEQPSLRKASPAASALPAQPLISVIIPVHNGSRFLAHAIGSILAQYYQNLDVVIVDDGSLDDIDAAVSRLPMEVRFLKQLNAGPAAARNRGIVNAAGEYIAFLDVDDLWPEGTLQAAMGELFADEDLDVVIGEARILVQQPETGGWLESDPTEKVFPYHISAALYRKRVFRRIGLFDDRLRFGEDTDWYLRAQDKGAAIKRVERVNLTIRRHDTNMTLNAGAELVPLRLFKNVLDRRRGASG